MPDVPSANGKRPHREIRLAVPCPNSCVESRNLASRRKLFSSNMPSGRRSLTRLISAFLVVSAFISALVSANCASEKTVIQTVEIPVPETVEVPALETVVVEKQLLVEVPVPQTVEVPVPETVVVESQLLVEVPVPQTVEVPVPETVVVESQLFVEVPVPQTVIVEREVPQTVVVDRTVQVIVEREVPVVVEVTVISSHPPMRWWEPRIVFSSNRDGDDEVYLMNVEESQWVQLTDNSTADRNPAWSHDGQRIAFESDASGYFAIYVMNLDGTGLVALTEGTTGDFDPDWSPDGERIVFRSNRDGDDEIYVMNADGSNVVRLTNMSTSEWDPRWSPDGSRIAFTSDRDGSQQLYAMNSDGSGIVKLTDTSAYIRNPAWSPDGARIAFASDQGGDFDIYVMNADGSGVTQLLDNNGHDANYELAWSPDGRHIVFASEEDGDNDIYVMNADGTEVVRITDNPFLDSSPSWSPTGNLVVSQHPSSPVSPTATPVPEGVADYQDECLVLSLQREGNRDIYAVNLDGSGERRITSDPAEDILLSLSRDGKRVVLFRRLKPDDSERLTDPLADELLTRRDIFMVDIGNSEEIQVFYDAINDGFSFGGWSRDGSRLAILARKFVDWNIYDHMLWVLDDQGAMFHPFLSHEPAYEIRQPSLSPDGFRVAFVSDDSDSGANEIFFINLAPYDKVRVTDTKSSPHKPLWSPDGEKIAFLADQGLWVINRDGSNLHRLTSDSSPEDGHSWPDDHSWSPDGKSIAFSHISGDGRVLSVIDADGSNERRIAAGPDQYVWSPDGEQIALIYGSEGKLEVFVADSARSGLTALFEVTFDEDDDRIVDPVGWSTACVPTVSPSP